MRRPPRTQDDDRDNVDELCDNDDGDDNGDNDDHLWEVEMNVGDSDRADDIKGSNIEEADYIKER